MTNTTLLSQQRSTFKLDLKKGSILIMLAALFNSFYSRLKPAKGLLAVLFPLLIAGSAMALPVIQTQPGQGVAEVCFSTPGSLTVVATAGGGGTINYQWQMVSRSGATLPADTLPGSSSWANITSGYTGTFTAPTLLIPSGYPEIENFYRCVLVEVGGSTPGTKITRSGNLLVVSGVPTFSVVPAQLYVCQGASAQFNVTVSGPGAGPHLLNYQWQVQEDSATWNNSNTLGSSTTRASTTNTYLTTNSFTYA